MTSHEPSTERISLRRIGSAKLVRSRVLRGNTLTTGTLLAEDLEADSQASGTVYDVIEHNGEERGGTRYRVWHRDDGDIVIYDRGDAAWDAYELVDDPFTDQVIAALGDAIYGAAPTMDADEREAYTETLTAAQQRAVMEQREAQHRTRRLTVPALEEIMYQAFPVLDHGFIRVVDYHGGDASVVQAARVSYGAGTRRVSDDRGLIRYLTRAQHGSPFEMAEIKLHVKLPIFVARQWIRHRTASVNELSARYSIVRDEFYVPDPSVVAAQAQANRQGRGAAFDEPAAEAVRANIRSHADESYQLYEELLQEQQATDGAAPGLARELARTVLPPSLYTEWFWQIDLRNLLHFLELRCDAHAQHEIRVYANVIRDEILQRWAPLVHEAFTDYQLESGTLSRNTLALVRELLQGRRAEAEAMRETSGIAGREWRETMEMLGLSE